MNPLSGQSLLDIAIQTSGSVEAAFALSIANGISLTDELPSEMKTVQVVNKKVADYYEARGIMPASEIMSNESIFSEQFNDLFE